MKKTMKRLLACMLLFTMAGCKKISPEAQAMIDQIKTAAEKSEYTAAEYQTIQDQYNALDDEAKKDVKGYEELTARMDEFFAQKKEEVKTAFNGQKFYLSEKEASVEVYHFDGDKIKVRLYEFNGNGKHEVASVDYDYICDGSTIQLKSSGPLEIKYSVNNGKLELDKKYFTAEQVLDGLQGDWTVSGEIFGAKSIYNLTISGNTAKFENASEALNRDNWYYYYGPYSGTITIDEGSVNITSDHGNLFFFSCLNGKVQIYRYGSLMKPGTGLKGEKGYTGQF